MTLPDDIEGVAQAFLRRENQSLQLNTAIGLFMALSDRIVSTGPGRPASVESPLKSPNVFRAFADVCAWRQVWPARCTTRVHHPTRTIESPSRRLVGGVMKRVSATITALALVAAASTVHAQSDPREILRGVITQAQTGRPNPNWCMVRSCGS